MTFDYGEFQALATDLFGQFKQGKIEIGKTLKGAGPEYNPGTVAPAWTEINGTVSGVSFQYVRDGLAMSSDAQIKTGVMPFEPDGSYQIRLDSNKVYRIVQCIRAPRVGPVIAWTIIIRKGAD